MTRLAGERFYNIKRAALDAEHCALKEGERTNEDRAAEAAVLCRLMSGMTGVDLHEENGQFTEEVISDIFAHLMHLATVEGYDIPKLVERGRNHYDAEIQGIL